jgi:hypothetical protein
MAGQGLERRQVLEILSLAAAASGFSGFHQWRFICQHHDQAAVTALRPASYTPQFFTASEYVTLECLTGLIIPSDGSPGAREAGVAEFIDFMVAHEPGQQYEFCTGLTWLDAHAQTLHGKPFRELESEQQSSILKKFAYREQHQPEEEDGRSFFHLVRRYTVMGFYTSRIGLEELNYPGLKFYSASPECPHHDDPEHLHLKSNG